MPRTVYKSSSPYYETTQTSWFLDFWEGKTIEPDSTDLQIEITPEFNLNPGLLSEKLYGTPDYRWVFALRNRDVLKDPLWDFTTGKKIWVPTKQRVESL